MYSQAKTERKNGRDVISLNGNSALMKRIFKRIDKHSQAWEKRIFAKSLVKPLFAEPVSIASEFINSDVFSEATMAQVVNHFLMGFASNIKGVLTNSPRQMKEAVEVNFSGGVTKDEAIKQLDTLAVNRNIYKLSSITHARGVFKNLIYRNAVDDGFEFFKMVIPDAFSIDGDQVIPQPKELAPSGMTIKFLFLILALNEWNKRTDDNNTAPVSGLGLHHNSFEYYLPIRGENLEEEKEISRNQRSELTQ
jgi:hypothetical protein